MANVGLTCSSGDLHDGLDHIIVASFEGTDGLASSATGLVNDDIDIARGDALF